MSDKIKELVGYIQTGFNFIKDNIILILGAVIGFLVYYITLKNKEVNAVRAQVDLVQTQKQADVLETQIKNKLQIADLLQKEIDGHTKTLDQLNQKRSSLPEDDSDPTKYWQNN